MEKITDGGKGKLRIWNEELEGRLEVLHIPYCMLFVCFKRFALLPFWMKST